MTATASLTMNVSMYSSLLHCFVADYLMAGSVPNWAVVVTSSFYIVLLMIGRLWRRLSIASHALNVQRYGIECMEREGMCMSLSVGRNCRERKRRKISGKEIDVYSLVTLTAEGAVGSNACLTFVIPISLAMTARGSFTTLVPSW